MDATGLPTLSAAHAAGSDPAPVSREAASHELLAPPPPAAAASAPVPPWRKRHPVLARVLLYGVGLAIVATAALLWAKRRERDEADRQASLLTTLDGVHQLVTELAPEVALAKIRADVLAKSPDEAVRRDARLVEASLLDRMLRYDEADAVYVALDREWPAGTPRGPLVVPWANMRISAGRVDEARAMLAAPDAVAGFPAADVAMVRARLSTPAPGAPAPGAGR